MRTATPALAPCYTAAQIAACLGKTSRTVRKQLEGIEPASVRVVAGNESATWSAEQFPATLREALEELSHTRGYGDCKAMLETPPKLWEPSLPLNEIRDVDLKTAKQLRDVLRPWLLQQHSLTLSVSEIEARGVGDYKRIFGHSITMRYWRELFTRTLRRDGGREDWTRLELYLPNNLIPKQTPERVVSDAIAAEFAEIGGFVAGFGGNSTAQQKQDLWILALQKHTELAGVMPARKAARIVRQFLFARAPFLSPSREALLKAFDRKLAILKAANGDFRALGADGREKNGNRVTISESDIKLLRWSAGIENGTRVDAAWREHYQELSEETRNRYPYSLVAPRAVHRALVRQKVNALAARHEGKRKLRRIIGGVEREWFGVPSMTTWVVDDMTSNIEVAIRNQDGSWSLIQPQIVAVMDSSSRKFVGWAISTDQGPTAELTCRAVLAAFRDHGVPKELGVENGFVFGRAININGKTDEEGRTVVAGLARYGCVMRHFEKMNPTSKAELEKGFDLIQRPMERHPGYAGRLQIKDAPEDFKREQRLIRSGKVLATDYRYTFPEFVALMSKIFAGYNAQPRRGWLQGVSPDEAFEVLKDPSDPPIQFTSELEWVLANERYLVTVALSGVEIRHYGRSLKVRGGRLANLTPSTQLWALVDRQDDSLVTFMNLNFTDPFTMEVCQKPSACERLIASGSGVLAKERAKVNEHVGAVNDEYNDLIQEFGNPRRELLLAMRNQQNPTEQPARVPVVPRRMAESAEEMLSQRGELRAERNEADNRARATKNRARKLGLPIHILNDRPESDEGTALMVAAKREHERQVNEATTGEPVI